jgi:hypothetical protein
MYTGMTGEGIRKKAWESKKLKEKSQETGKTGKREKGIKRRRVPMWKIKK